MSWINPAQFTISPSQEVYTGVRVDTSVIAVDDIPISSHTWYFGDGTVYTVPEPTHAYSNDGVYEIIHTVCDFRGNTYTAQTEITANNYVTDAITLSSTDPTLIASVASTLQLSVTSTKPGPHIVTLHVEDSDSAPTRVPARFFDHLVPQWGFYSVFDDLMVNSLTEASVDTTPVTVNGAIVGHRGSVCVKFKDEMPGTPIIWATLQQETGVNSRVYAAESITVTALDPEYVSITHDGISPINSKQWCGGKVPAIMTVNATSVDGPIILHHIPTLGSLTFELSSTSTGVSGTGAAVTSATDVHCLHSGSFAKFLLEVGESGEIVLDGAADGVALGTSFSLTTSETISAFPFYDASEVRVHNEDRDLSDIIKGYAPPHLSTMATKYFDEYLPAIIGTPQDNDPMALGLRMFERIANFTTNHGDIDTCGVDQLLSKAEQYDVAYDDYGIAFPPDLKRIVDIASVHYDKLWGVRCACMEHFQDCIECCGGDLCPVCGTPLQLNRGPRLDCATYVVSAGNNLVYHAIADEVFHLLHTVPLADGSTTYNLNQLEVGNLQLPICDNYEFYEYVEGDPGGQIEGIISWDNCLTLVPEETSQAQWYAEGGVLEQIFDFYLHRGLGLVNDSCPIPDLTCVTQDPECPS